MKFNIIIMIILFILSLIILGLILLSQKKKETYQNDKAEEALKTLIASITGIILLDKISKNPNLQSDLKKVITQGIKYLNQEQINDLISFLNKNARDSRDKKLVEDIRNLILRIRESYN